MRYTWLWRRLDLEHMMRRWEGTEEKNKVLHQMESREGTQIQAVSLEFDVTWLGMTISL